MSDITMDIKRVAYLEKLLKMPKVQGPLTTAKAEAQIERLNEKVNYQLTLYFDDESTTEGYTYDELIDGLQNGWLEVTEGDPKKLAAYLKLAEELYDQYDGAINNELYTKPSWTKEEILKEATNMFVAYSRMRRWTDKDIETINDIAGIHGDLRKGIRLFIENVESKRASLQGGPKKASSMEPQRLAYLERLFKLQPLPLSLRPANLEDRRDEIVSKVLYQMVVRFGEYDANKLSDVYTFLELAQSLEKGHINVKSGDPRVFARYLREADELDTYYDQVLDEMARGDYKQASFKRVSERPTYVFRELVSLKGDEAQADLSGIRDRNIESLVKKLTARNNLGKDELKQIDKSPDYYQVTVRKKDYYLVYSDKPGELFLKLYLAIPQKAK